jgi:hypothetical protein
VFAYVQRCFTSSLLEAAVHSVKSSLGVVCMYSSALWLPIYYDDVLYRDDPVSVSLFAVQCCFVAG